LNRELSVRDRTGQARTRLLETPVELVRVLDEAFGLRFPPETIFPCAALDWPELAASRPIEPMAT
jgi:hypothetical protein